jgi:hypothetical protein
MALFFFLGKFTLVAFIVALMGVPVVYYLKRDKKWQESGADLNEWYNR